jgi:hypothetical protein
LNLLQATLLEIGGTEELVGVPSDSGLRVAVEEKARVFGCLEAISNLAIIDAVRFLQQKERYTPCFGGESPLVPSPESAKLCGVLECYWKVPCDTHRLMPAASLEECMNEEVVRNMEEVILAPGQTASKDEKSELPADNGEQTVAEIISRLADSAGAFVAAIRELAHRSSGWNDGVNRQLAGLTDRFDQLAEVVFEQQVVNAETHEKHQQLSAAVESLAAADARHESEVAALRTHLQSTVAGLSSKLDVWCERLGRQGDVLNRLCEEQAQRAAALDQFLVVLSRLRTSAATTPANG